MKPRSRLCWIRSKCVKSVSVVSVASVAVHLQQHQQRRGRRVINSVPAEQQQQQQQQQLQMQFQHQVLRIRAGAARRVKAMTKMRTTRTTTGAQRDAPPAHQSRRARAAAAAAKKKAPPAAAAAAAAAAASDSAPGPARLADQSLSGTESDDNARRLLCNTCNDVREELEVFNVEALNKKLCGRCLVDLVNEDLNKKPRGPASSGQMIAEAHAEALQRRLKASADELDETTQSKDELQIMYQMMEKENENEAAVKADLKTKRHNFERNRPGLRWTDELNPRAKKALDMQASMLVHEWKMDTHGKQYKVEALEALRDELSVTLQEEVGKVSTKKRAASPAAQPKRQKTGKSRAQQPLRQSSGHPLA
ncbi:hypothetical protein JKP88DRAFT_274678 [Tribonema minus]|uniref:Uncharacterized protein n=1 Tax=Tribonema minus TaxID=303371 RepID=A0A835ZKG4_9STRA|nr:hypothetical protein JKP88DRAFT_274678 [Tribonema minus]